MPLHIPLAFFILQNIASMKRMNLSCHSLFLCTDLSSVQKENGGEHIASGAHKPERRFKLWKIP